MLPPDVQPPPFYQAVWKESGQDKFRVFEVPVAEGYVGVLWVMRDACCVLCAVCAECCVLCAVYCVLCAVRRVLCAVEQNVFVCLFVPLLLS